MMASVNQLGKNLDEWITTRPQREVFMRYLLNKKVLKTVPIILSRNHGDGCCIEQTNVPIIVLFKPTAFVFLHELSHYLNMGLEKPHGKEFCQTFSSLISEWEAWRKKNSIVDHVSRFLKGKRAGDNGNQI